MKVNMVKINNYKSIGKEKNILTIGDINIIVGKNESGKSNVVEALSGIDLTGFTENGYFERKNKMDLTSPVSVELELEPYKSELKKDKKLSKMKINIDSYYDIKYEGGFSESIKNNKEFIIARNTVLDIIENNTINWKEEKDRKNFNNLLENLKNAENKVFINFKYIDELITRLENSSYDDFKEELTENLKKCKKILNSYHNYFPYFFFIDDYTLKSEYTHDEIENENTPEVQMLEKMLVAANIDFQKFISYWDNTDNAIKKQMEKNYNASLKNNLVDKFNKFYTQEQVSVEFDFHESSVSLLFDTTGTYMSYDERSQGLKWYFNTFVKMQAENLDDNNVIYIMDEPGTKLHVNAQKELISFFKDLSKKENQIIYTTHSPYMLDQGNLNYVRLVSKDDNGYTYIYNKFHSFPDSDKTKIDTMTPIYDAMGFDYKYNFGPSSTKKNIVVEGPSDYNYIQAYLSQKKLNVKSTPYIIPSMGVDNINRIISILIGWGCDYAIILDNDIQGRTEYQKLLNKLNVSKYDISFTDGTNELDKKANHMIENVFSKDDYDKFIKQPDYENLKNYYSKQLLERIVKKEITFSNETMNNFDKIFMNILK